MQAQGTDGLSRGNLDSGVLQGTHMLSYVPLHVSALDREPRLQDWVQSWFGVTPFSWLQPFDWFHTGHHILHAVWTPPPAAAEVALEQLAAAIHKRPHSQHVVLIPRLFCPAWQKLLAKLCDIIFLVPLGSDIWPSSHFEPLLIGIYFPLSHHRPWRFQNTPLLDDLAGKLSSLPCSDFNWGGNLLREFLCTAGALDSMPPSVARKLLLRN